LSNYSIHDCIYWSKPTTHWIDSLESTDPSVRRVAILVLGEIYYFTDNYPQLVVDHLENETYPKVLSEICDSLRAVNMSSEDVIKRLSNLINHSDGYLGLSAAHTILQLGPIKEHVYTEIEIALENKMSVGKLRYLLDILVEVESVSEPIVSKLLSRLWDEYKDNVAHYEEIPEIYGPAKFNETILKCLSGTTDSKGIVIDSLKSALECCDEKQKELIEAIMNKLETGEKSDKLETRRRVPHRYQRNRPTSVPTGNVKIRVLRSRVVLDASIHRQTGEMTSVYPNGSFRGIPYDTLLALGDGTHYIYYDGNAESLEGEKPKLDIQDEIDSSYFFMGDSLAYCIKLKMIEHGAEQVLDEISSDHIEVLKEDVMSLPKTAEEREQLIYIKCTPIPEEVHAKLISYFS
jgi:hypothetical protein